MHLCDISLFFYTHAYNWKQRFWASLAEMRLKKMFSMKKVPVLLSCSKAGANGFSVQQLNLSFIWFLKFIWQEKSKISISRRALIHSLVRLRARVLWSPWQRHDDFGWYSEVSGKGTNVISFFLGRKWFAAPHSIVWVHTGSPNKYVLSTKRIIYRLASNKF